MSGALHSVFGGGGILGAALNMASMFFPPLAIATSLGNLLSKGIGQAVSQAVQTLTQEFGMPKFLGDMVKNLASEVTQAQQKPSDPGADAMVDAHQGTQDFMKNFIKDLSDKIIEGTRKQMEEKGEAAGAKGGKGKASAGSWLQAIAIAMGQIAGDKAAQMVELSKQMADLNGKGQELTGQLKGLGKDDTKAQQDIQSQQQDNARQFSVVQSQFQATSQEFSILQNTFSNAIKSIGEGLTTMGRKG